MVAKGMSKEPEALRGLPLPAILFWNFNHFVVLVDHDDRNVTLHDPAVGQRHIAWEELDQAFTGVVLTFVPTSTFQRQGEAPSTWKSLATWLGEARPVYLAIALISALILVPTLILPFGARAFVDDVLLKSQRNWTYILVVGLIATAVLRALLSALQNMLLGHLETLLGAKASAKTMWHLLGLPTDYFAQRFAGELASRIAIGGRIGQVAAAEIPELFFQSLLAGVVLAIMFSMSVWLSLISVLFAASQFAVLRTMSRRRTTLNQRLAMDQGRAHGVTLSGLTQMESIRANGTESTFFDRWAGYYARYRESSTRLLTAVALWSSMPAGLALSETAALVWFGGHQVISGALSVGSVVAFQSLAMTFSEPVRRLVQLGERLQELRGDLDRIEDVLRAPPDEVAAHEEGASVQGSAHSDPAGTVAAIELRGVTFGYNPAAQPLLTGFDLRVEVGQRVALVGPTGCGKSTVARLIAGVHKPWCGEVLLAGRPRSHWDSTELANYISLVEQDVVLFEGSVADNLTLWNPAVTDADMKRALHDACLEQELIAWHDRVDGTISEGGSNLSGGQRQRLDIARALTLNPVVLIFDEATSALDPVVELQLEHRLRARGGTSVQVAHRLSSIRDCDRIYVMQSGKIVQSGTHDELIHDREGAYWQLNALELDDSGLRLAGLA